MERPTTIRLSVHHSPVPAHPRNWMLNSGSIWPVTSNLTSKPPAPSPKPKLSPGKEPTLRFQGKSRLGFYPLPLSEAQRIRRFLCFPDAPSSAIDPCVGDVFGTQLVWKAMEITGEILHRRDVTLDGSRRVISTLEFFEHHLA